MRTTTVYVHRIASYEKKLLKQKNNEIRKATKKSIRDIGALGWVSATCSVLFEALLINHAGGVIKEGRHENKLAAPFNELHIQCLFLSINVHYSIYKGLLVVLMQALAKVVIHRASLVPRLPNDVGQKRDPGDY